MIYLKLRNTPRIMCKVAVILMMQSNLGDHGCVLFRLRQNG